MKKTLPLLLTMPFLGCDCEGDGGLFQKNADIKASPDPLVFDTVPRGTTASRMLHVENPGDLRLDVSSVSIESGDGFSIAGETAFAVEPGASRDVEVRFTANDLDSVDGTLLIRSNAEGKEELRVTLKATRREGPVLVVCVESADIPLALTCGSPSAIDFGRVRLNETHEAKVTLRSEGTDPVAVSSVALSGHPSIEIDAPALPATIAAGELVAIPVRFTASVQEQIRGSIAIASNDAVAPNAEVTIRGEGAELGLCVEPAMLDFGGVKVGSSKDLSLQLTNCGSAPIEITGAEIYVGADRFSVVAPITTPINLPAQAGLSFELKVRYAPISEGEDEGRLRIHTANGSALVHLTGDSNACQLVATPSSLSFSYDPERVPSSKVVLIENNGTQDCTVTRVEIVAPDDSFSFYGTVGPDRERPGQMLTDLPKVLRPTETIEASVSFVPYDLHTEPYTAKIEIEVEERPNHLFVVDLLGTVDVTSECALTASPMTLSFGILQVGTKRSLGTHLINQSGTCKLDSIELVEDAGGAFTLPANMPDLVFGDVTLFVDFAPTTAGIFQGSVQVVTEGGAQTLTIALNGAAGSSSLCVAPRELPFGDRSTAGTLDFNLSACGSDPVTVTALDWTTPDPELSILNPPALPFTLDAGDTRTITVLYDPQDQIGDTGIITVRSNDVARPEITVRATGGREIVPPEAGRYLYYWQIQNGAMSDIARQPLQGDLTSRPYWGDRAGQGCGACHNLSPDGKYLAVGTLNQGRGRISIVDVEAYAIATAPGNQVDSLYMSWNPDVNTNPPYQYVYSLNGDLHVASLYTGYIGPLAGASDPNEHETMPAWGPDGQIAFVRSETGCGVGCIGATSIYLVNEAGGSPIALAGASNNNIANYYPRYSPNGTWIAYTISASAQSTVSAPDAQIRLVKADNSGTVLDLATLNDGASSYPTWSADGRFLSFSSNRAGGLGNWDIWLAPIDPVTGQDGAAFNLQEANTPDFEHAAQWSP